MGKEMAKVQTSQICSLQYLCSKFLTNLNKETIKLKKKYKQGVWSMHSKQAPAIWPHCTTLV